MQSSSPYLPLVLLLLLAVMVLSVKARKLTLAAAFMALAIGLSVLQAAQLKGVAMLMAFFGLSVLATSHKKNLKIKLNSENKDHTGRNTGQVIANGGIAGLMGLLAIIDPVHSASYQLMMAASLASALSDTLSSELGMVYGRHYYNIVSLKKDENGKDGVVSLEGTFIGAAGALIIALIYSGFSKQIWVILAAGIFGNLCDSILGATLEQKQLIGNNTVNFLNTLIAALFALLIS